MALPRRFGGPIDLMGFALVNACLNPLSSDPTGLGAADAGRVWWNTTSNTAKIWSGTAAVDLLARASQTGSQTASTISDFTSAVRALAWSSMQAPSASVPMAGQTLSGMRAGAAAGEAVEYAQFQNAIAAVQSGMDFKNDAIEVVATTNVNLSAPGSSMNGRTMQAGDSVLLTAQTTPSANGVYVWNSATSLTRRSDSNTNGSLQSGTLVAVSATDGTNPDTIWMQTAVGTAAGGAITIGTDSQTWIKPFTATTYTQGNGVSILGGVIAAVAAGSPNAADAAAGSGNGILVGAAGIYIDPATGVRKVYGTIPASSTGIYTITGSTVVIADGINNINKSLTLKAGSAPQSIGGVTPSQGEEVTVGNIASTSNMTVGLPAAPTVNAWTYMIEG